MNRFWGEYDKQLERAGGAPLYWGYYRNNNVMRSASSYWHETHYPVCDELYVAYALGGGYLIDMRAVREYLGPLLRHEWLTLIKAEDAWTSTALSPLNMRRVHDVRFDTSHGKRDCAPFYLVLHKNDAAEQRALHTHLQLSPNNSCAPDTHHDPNGINMYAYDPRVPPFAAGHQVRVHPDQPDHPKLTDWSLWDDYSRSRLQKYLVEHNVSVE